jgi:D-alanyl-lipoteichoic acid acyltransferase DltB (MBOAT superfamily)
VGTWSDSLFNGAATGIVPSLIDSWVGVLSFSLLIYFDFSAYSDMAIGLSKMFGIRLPENFNSPYKATSIIDFWRRWHMTLSRFLRDYLYVPLGGNRCGKSRRYLNLMLVMLLAGIWHGASWKFAIWGGMHGLYLLVNHFWREVTSLRIYKPLGIGITFLAVTFAWVPFRADTWQTAMTVYSSMLGWNGIVLPIHYQELLPNTLSLWMLSHGVTFGATSVYGGVIQLVILGILMVVVWFLPNTQQITADFKPTLGSEAPPVTRLLRWEPARSVAIGMGIVAAYLLLLAIQGKAGEFIYFQF